MAKQRKEEAQAVTFTEEEYHAAIAEARTEGEESGYDSGREAGFDDGFENAQEQFENEEEDRREQYAKDAEWQQYVECESVGLAQRLHAQER